MLHARERPRERLLDAGAAGLATAELVALVLGTGRPGRSVELVAQDLIDDLGGLGALARATPHELAARPGLGAARAARLAAAFELGRRALSEPAREPRLTSAAAVFDHVRPRLAGLGHEVALALALDRRNGLIATIEVARGGQDAVLLGPRDVFRPLLRVGAAGFVLVHNHPSGDPRASSHDRELTRALAEAGALIGLPLVDHVIVGAGSFTSLGDELALP